MYKNKKITSAIIFISLFCLASFSSAQIQNPLAAYSFGELLAQIALKVGELVAMLGGIMVIIAGILYLTSAGSPERINTAKKALTYAIIGIAIGLAASMIVSTVCYVVGTTC